MEYEIWYHDKNIEKREKKPENTVNQYEHKRNGSESSALSRSLVIAVIRDVKVYYNTEAKVTKEDAD